MFSENRAIYEITKNMEGPEANDDGIENMAPRR
jgi:hypothetical protein